MVTFRPEMIGEGWLHGFTRPETRGNKVSSPYVVTIITNNALAYSRRTYDVWLFPLVHSHRNSVGKCHHYSEITVESCSYEAIRSEKVEHYVSSGNFRNFMTGEPYLSRYTVVVDHATTPRRPLNVQKFLAMITRPACDAVGLIDGLKEELDALPPAFDVIENANYSIPEARAVVFKHHGIESV